MKPQAKEKKGQKQTCYILESDNFLFVYSFYSFFKLLSY